MFKYATPLQFISFSGQFVGHLEPLTRQGGQSLELLPFPPDDDEVELPPLELVRLPDDELLDAIEPDEELLLELDKPPEEDEEDVVVKAEPKLQILSEVANRLGRAGPTSRASTAGRAGLERPPDFPIPDGVILSEVTCNIPLVGVPVSNWIPSPVITMVAVLFPVPDFG